MHARSSPQDRAAAERPRSWLQRDRLAVAQLLRAFDDDALAGRNAGEQFDFAVGALAGADDAKLGAAVERDEDGFHLPVRNQRGRGHANGLSLSSRDPHAAKLSAA